MIITIKHLYSIIRNTTRDIGLVKRSSKWAAVEKHFKLNNPSCAICGSKERLNVHHKKPFHLYPEFELDFTNLISLCTSSKNCHLLIGHGDNFRLYNSDIDSDVDVLQKDISKFDLIVIKAKENAYSNI